MSIPALPRPAAAALALFAAGPALAQTVERPTDTTPPPSAERTLPPVIVTGTQSSLTVPSNEQEAVRLRTIPGNVTLIPSSDWRDRAGVTTLPDMLSLTPGVFAAPKWGGDSRLSIRGSGLARNFHLRGILVLQDGIPLNQADGSGDLQELDPLTLERLEVLRGGNAFYLGANTLGGAIRATTPTGRSDPGALVRGEGGSFGFARGQIAYGVASGQFDAYGTYTGVTDDGFRDHSAGHANRYNGNIGWRPRDDLETRFYLSYNNIYQQIPGTVSRTQALTQPKLAAPVNELLNYQRNIESLRVGNRTVWRPTDGVELEAGLGLVSRELDHPIFQYIDQRNQDGVVFFRGTIESTPGGLTNRLRFGANFAMGTTESNRYVNRFAQAGALTASSLDRARTGDVYAENALYVLPNVALIAGLQGGEAYRASRDRFLTDGNQSGSATYGWVNPGFGALWDAAPGIQGYANVTWSTEPPTLSDLLPLVPLGGFSRLKAQRAVTAEVGTRGESGAFTWDVALYRAQLENEIQLFAIGQSAALAVNAGPTMHQGVEAGLGWMMGQNLFAETDSLTLRQAYTFSDFRFDGDSVWGNNQLPGAPRNLYQAEARYRHPAGWFAAPTLTWVPQAFYVDNANTLKTDAYALVGLRAGWDLGNGLSMFADARNLGDVKYISSASVVPRAVPNQALMEPGFGRSVYAGLQLRF